VKEALRLLEDSPLLANDVQDLHKSALRLRTHLALHKNVLELLVHPLVCALHAQNELIGSSLQDSGGIRLPLQRLRLLTVHLNLIN